MYVYICNIYFSAALLSIYVANLSTLFCSLYLTTELHYVHVIVVTWARGICLICMPEARGPQARVNTNEFKPTIDIRMLCLYKEWHKL